ncbi:hypothetical protein LBMAG53_27900 [Planctomycetota bacterium]|nr:hypothetical protein LBMAG53_27900 [Planctomycetota bacterium]
MVFAVIDNTLSRMHEQPEVEPRGRGGRPAKAHPRNLMIKVAFSDEEHRWVVERAAAHDLSLSDYCRRKVLGRTVPFGETSGKASGDFSETLARMEGSSSARDASEPADKRPANPG